MYVCLCLGGGINTANFSKYNLVETLIKFSITNLSLIINLHGVFWNLCATNFCLNKPHFKRN